MTQDKSLPDGWKKKKLGEITRVLRGASPRPKGDPKYFGGSIPWIKISDVTGEPGKFLSSTVDHVTVEGASKSKLLKKGSLILSICATVCVPKILSVDGCIHDGFVYFPDLSDEINLSFLYYYFESIRTKIIQENRQGMTQVNLNTGIVSDFPIAIPSLPEQERIVAKIEELFTDLDAGVAALQRAQAGLKRYKASVLKAACEGRLVLQDPSDEPAAEMLHRLGKQPLAGDDLPPLPQGWCWTKVSEIYAKIQYGTSDKADENPLGIPVLRMGNILDGQISLTKLKYLPKDTPGIHSYILEEGDLIFNRTNSAELVGKTSVFKGCNQVMAFASYLIRVRLNEGCFPEYLSSYINSSFGRSYISSVVSQQVGQANVNGTKLANMRVPLPPKKEQMKIVTEAERCMSLANFIEKAINIEIARASRLRQSILQQAFAGKLLNTDHPLLEPVVPSLENSIIGKPAAGKF